MPQRESSKYLFDILEACKNITSFVDEKSFDDYAADALLRSAVERQFEIIGEALNQLLKIEPGFKASISDCSRIVAFRNRLVHGYADVHHETVWAIVDTMLPRLCDEVANLIGE